MARSRAPQKMDGTDMWGHRTRILSYIAERANRNKKTAEIGQQDWRDGPNRPDMSQAFCFLFPNMPHPKFVLLEFHPTGIDFEYSFTQFQLAFIHSLSHSIAIAHVPSFSFGVFSSKNCAIYFCATQNSARMLSNSAYHA